MTYKYTSANIIEDGSGRKVEIKGRTEVIYSFRGREILIGSEVLSGDFGIALYADYHRLERPGSGEICLLKSDISEAVSEIARALRDVGTRVEIL